MTRTTVEKRAAFRVLHEQGCFVLPNPWDAGSARLMQHAGFAAVASTSSGFAWSSGRPDYASTCDRVVNHLAMLCDAVDVPVNADFESGFASEPGGLATNVARAIATGIAGLSIEDRDIQNPLKLYDATLSVERIRAARSAIMKSGKDVILVGRTEMLLSDPAAITPAIDKLIALGHAGADCLFAPGLRNKADIATVVREVAPKPLNVMVMGNTLNVAELTDLGVRRISLGAGLARVALGAVLAALEGIKSGTFDDLSGAPAGKRLNGIFGEFAQTAD